MNHLHQSKLGKDTQYPERYDKSLLFRIPRAENRLKYNIYPDNLPFTGLDVWNAYEISFLTDNGLPLSAMMKMSYSASSKYLVESKSLKLYLNSFNMEPCGKTMPEAFSFVQQKMAEDLSELLETEVRVSIFGDEHESTNAFPELKRKNLTQLIDSKVLENITLTKFNESPELLTGIQTSANHYLEFRSDLLRSNCPVTNQPDWGDLFVKINSAFEIDLSSIIAYLVSFRRENHFHEEVVEMIFKRLYDRFSPSDLMVAAMYTRRGGIDINPIRATHPELIEKAFTDNRKLLAKTFRQ